MNGGAKTYESGPRQQGSAGESYERYLKRLEDIDRSVLRALIEESVTTTRKRYPRE
jgi:hypothetical protein